MTIKFRRIVSLARTRTHNRAKLNKTLEDILPLFEMNQDDMSDLSKSFKQPKDQYILEIGFGSGENILAMAKANPNYGYIGCEVFAGGVMKLLEGIEQEKLDNIRIWHDDALEFIPNIPDHSLDLIYILHPDPWPKKRHNKRRLINISLLRLLAQKLIIGGKLLIITDHQDYADNIKETVKEVNDIYTQAFDDYPTIVKTKYRLKADAQEIESHYFCLIR